MIERNKNVRVFHSAKIIFKNKQRSLFSKQDLIDLEQEINNIQDEVKRAEGLFVLEYFMHGTKIVLDNKGQIMLFGVISRRIEYNWKISNNKVVYNLLKKMIQS